MNKQKEMFDKVSQIAKAMEEIVNRDILVGFVGYSKADYDEEKAAILVSSVIDALPRTASLVSGLTNIGIPALVYKYAGGRKTVGIACAKAKDYECFPVDHEIIEGEEWGDESDLFLTNIDLLVKIGGGEQSKEEFSKYKGPKFKFQL